jgi:carbamoyl-phosphate synthase large subunit
VAGAPLEALSAERLRALKQAGFSDARLATLLGTKEGVVRAQREALGIRPVYKTVDTCGAEFVAHTPYLYSTYEPGDDESQRTDRRKIVILGGGPNRIGQGIEFDYCCVHAAFSLREAGYEAIMVNCNPETVSTDYDTSDKLYFEPLTFEDALALIERERPDGVIVQFGGQTPLKLAVPLERAGVKIIGTAPDSIDRAEDRERFEEVLTKLDLRRPPNGIARSEAEATRVAKAIGYPILVRPSYVLGGRAMEIVYDEPSLAGYMRRAVRASPEHPVLIDRFLEDAIEVDVDAVSDGHDVVVAGIMEHIERAGVHSGDSACSLPPYSIDAEVQAEIARQTIALARELDVIGLMNVQFAVKDRVVYVLEVNPRASRTVPFVSKAIGVPLAKVAVQCMIGRRLAEIGFTQTRIPTHVSVKEAVFPFIKFPGVDTVLGPEMKSTGEVMGIDETFGAAFAKAQVAAGTFPPDERHRVRIGSGRREGRAAAGGAHARSVRVHPHGDGRHGELPRGAWPRRHGRQARAARKPECRRRAPTRADRARHQYARRGRGVSRLVPAASHGARVPGALRDDDRGGCGRGRGHRDDDPRAVLGPAPPGVPPSRRVRRRRRSAARSPRCCKHSSDRSSTSPRTTSAAPRRRSSRSTR